MLSVGQAFSHEHAECLHRTLITTPNTPAFLNSNLAPSICWVLSKWEPAHASPHLPNSRRWQKGCCKSCAPNEDRGFGWNLKGDKWENQDLDLGLVKNPSVNARDAVQSLGQEDSLEEETATHSSILAWRIPMDRAWWAAVHGVTKSWTQLSD